MVLMEINIERIFHDVRDVNGCRGGCAIVGSLNLHPKRVSHQLPNITNLRENRSTYFGVVFLRFGREILPDEEMVRREET